jgi:hypothetical protein
MDLLWLNRLWFLLVREGIGYGEIGWNAQVLQKLPEIMTEVH